MMLNIRMYPFVKVSLPSTEVFAGLFAASYVD